MLIHSASQLITLAGGPQRGKALGSLGVIPNGAVVIRDETIIAVGTTSTRTLEAIYGKYGKFVACKEATDIFISPGYKFRAIDALITNFHLPKSTLIMLVSAFIGREFTMQIYQHAIKERYWFFSFGDAMFIYGSQKELLS